MASNWTVVAGTVLGACIGIVQAEVIRHRGAKDAAAARAEQLREDRERLLEERESSALRAIVDATHLLPPISRATDPSDETIASIQEFTRRVAYTCLQLQDEELRFRLMIGVEALDLAKDDELPRFGLAEAVYIVRHMLRAAVGATMRNEPLPDGSLDWARLSAATIEGTEGWRATQRREGFDATGEYDELRRRQLEGGDGKTSP